MIDLPTWAKNIRVDNPTAINEDGKLLYDYPQDSHNRPEREIELPPGEYEIVGTGTLSSDLAEKIAALCGGVTLLSKLTTGPHDPIETRPATLEEVIESKGFFLRNPYGEEPKGKIGVLTNNEYVISAVKKHYKERYEVWQAAEAKTLKNPVFIKIIKP